MARTYRMNRRAEFQEATRARILEATMALHDEKGVAATTLSDVAERAGVSPSTVSRHFPTLGDLVQFCGMHVWQEMQPPTPDTASAVFDGASTLGARLDRLVAELDAFYARAGFRLRKAAQDADRVPELAAFLAAVDQGLRALVREALRDVPNPGPAANVVLAVTRLEAWTALDAAGAPGERAQIKRRLIACAIGSVGSD